MFNALKTWLPRIVLAIIFVLVGALKFRDQSVYVRIFNDIGIGTWFRYLTGVIEIGGAILLLIPARAALGFVLLGSTMVGAIAFWILTHHAFGAIIPGVLLLAILGFGWTEITSFLGSARRSASTT